MTFPDAGSELRHGRSRLRVVHRQQHQRPQEIRIRQLLVHRGFNAGLEVGQRVGLNGCVDQQREVRQRAVLIEKLEVGAVGLIALRIEVRRQTDRID